MDSKGTRVASVLVAFFNGVWYLMAIALVLAVCLAVVGSPAAVRFDADGGPNIVVGANPRMAIPVTFSVDAATVRAQAVALDIDDAEIQDAHGVLSFPPPRGSWVALTTAVVMIGFAMWIVGQLRALCRTLRNGTPFAAANVTRVRRIAYAVIAGEIARAALVFAANKYAALYFAADGLILTARPHFNMFALVDGLIVLALAEVFRAGRRLEDDQALTV